MLVTTAPAPAAADILRDVVPMRAPVFRVPDFAVVRAGPDQSFLNRRRGDRKNHFAVKLSQIIADDSARTLTMYFGSCVERSGLITDPALPGVAWF